MGSCFPESEALARRDVPASSRQERSIPVRLVFARRSLSLALWVFAVMCAGNNGRAADSLVVIRIDAAHGVDDAARIAESLPVQTVGFALAHAAAGAQVELQLASGVYAEPLESFPWSVPVEVASLAIVAAEDASEPAVIAPPPDAPAVFDLERQDRPFGLRIADLVLRGGIAAVRASFLRAGPSVLRVEHSRFESLDRPALEVLAESTRLDVVLRESEFVGEGALSLEAAGAARIEVDLDGNEFRGSSGFGAEGFFGGAVELHASDDGEIALAVRRSRFIDTANALVLSSSGSGAVLDVVVLSSLIATSAEPSCSAIGTAIGCGVQHVVYSALRDPERVSLRFLHDTFFGIERAIVAVEDPESLAGGTFESEWIGNVFLGDGGRPLGTWMADLDLGTDRLHGDLALRGNLVAPEWLETLAPVDGGGNRAPSGPVFLDASADDFRLAADSEAIDAGDVASEIAALLGASDLGGACRISGPTDGSPAELFRVDLGAYELEVPGGCLFAAFIRGDCNRTATVDISDAIFTFTHLFVGGVDPSCPDACDSNDDGSIDISDGIGVLGWLFLSGPAPRAPFPRPGADPSSDRLTPCPIAP